jgi:uncharacterized membrane protein YhaH (DUF805 family)
MHWWLDLFLTFGGRINRKAFWLGEVPLMALLALFYLAIWLGGYVDYSATTSDAERTAAFAEQTKWPSLALALVSLVPTLALYIKRTHDLGWSGWWTGGAFAVMMVFSVGYYFGLTGAPGQLNLLGWSLIMLNFVLSLLVFVPLATMRGEVGANRFGPDPLPPHASNPAALSWTAGLFGLRRRLARSGYGIGLASALAIFATLFTVASIYLVVVITLRTGVAVDAMPDEQVELYMSELMQGADGIVFWAIAGSAALLLGYNLVALSAQRLHDRDRRGWWLVAPLLLVGGGLGIGILLRWRLALYIGLGAGALALLWLLVEISLLRGTPGDNRFGPDPLAFAELPEGELPEG